MPSPPTGPAAASQLRPVSVSSEGRAARARLDAAGELTQARERAERAHVLGRGRALAPAHLRAARVRLRAGLSVAGLGAGRGATGALAAGRGVRHARARRLGGLHRDGVELHPEVLGAAAVQAARERRGVRRQEQEEAEQDEVDQHGAADEAEQAPVQAEAGAGRLGGLLRRAEEEAEVADAELDGRAGVEGERALVIEHGHAVPGSAELGAGGGAEHPAAALAGREGEGGAHLGGQGERGVVVANGDRGVAVEEAGLEGALVPAEDDLQDVGIGVRMGHGRSPFLFRASRPRGECLRAPCQPPGFRNH